MDKLSTLVRSRRFWAAVGGVAVVVLRDGLGLTEDQALTITGLASAWILGDSLSKTG